MPTKYNRKTRRTLEERFWSKVDRSGGSNACWLWTASVDGCGYGRILVDGKARHAHRIAFILTYGFIADDLCVCHTCDIPPCVNPAHLWSGTRKDNMADKVAKGRQNGPQGVTHHSAKLTEAQISEIRDWHTHGIGQRTLAMKYGVSRSAIKKIVRYRSWKHLP